MPSRMTRDRHLFVGMAVVFAAALAARLIFLADFSTVPIFDSPTMDMLYHDQWARDILAGQGVAYVPFFRAPLYPYVLALIYLIFGTGGWAVGLVQSVLGSVSAVLVFLIGRRLAGHRAGLAAGLLTALWGTLIFFDAQRLVVALAVVLDLAALYCLLPDGSRPRARLLFLGGLLLGLSAIARPTILLFAAGYALWLIGRVRRRASGMTLSHAALFLAALAAPVLSVTAYNVAVSGQPVVIGTYSGLNFYIGNRQGADGVSAQLPGARQDWWGMMEDAAQQAEREAGRPLTESEQSTFWWRRAATEIFDDPAAWVVLLGKKTLFLLQGIELSNNIDFYYFAHRSRLLRLLVWGGPLCLPWGLLIPPALIGLIVGLRQSPGARVLAWFAISYGAAVVLFFVTARYRLPLAPMVALFAVVGLQYLWKSFGRTSPVGRAGVILVLASGYVVANVDFFRHAPGSEAPGLFTMAAAYEREHEFETAEDYYRAAVIADPTFVQAYNDLGMLQISRGDVTSAVETLSAGLRAVPEHPTLLYNLAYAHLVAGNAAPAVPLLRAALAQEADNLDALNNLATALMMTNRFDSARICYEEILWREPAFQVARFGLGWALQEQGQLDSARACFRASAAAGVNVAESWYRMGRIWIAEGKIDSAVITLTRCRDRLRAERPGEAAEVEALLDSLVRK